MRYFNTVLFTLAMVVAISFGWSLHPDVSWWEAIQHMTHGSTFGWLFSVGLSLPILLGSRRWPIRAWLRVVMTLMPTAWLGLTLALRGEWLIIVMIAVSTAIMTIFATPGSPKSRTSTPGAWRRRLRSLFVEPDRNATATTTN